MLRLRKFSVILVILLIFMAGTILPSCARAQERQGLIPVTKVNGDYLLHLTVDFDSNLILARYDVTLSVDGQEIAVIPHGKLFDGFVGVSAGVHTLAFSQSGNVSVQCSSQFRITDDSIYSCTIHAHLFGISMRDELLNGREIDHGALETELFIASCSRPDYEKICRYPEQASGSNVILSGRVLQTAEFPFRFVVLMSLQTTDGIWYVPFRGNTTDARILPGDYITVYGECLGVSGWWSGSGFVLEDFMDSVPMAIARCIVTER